MPQRVPVWIVLAIAVPMTAVIVLGGRWLLGMGAGPEASRAPSAATARPTAPAPAETLSYTVRPGDSLSGLAARYGTSVEALMALNGLANPDALHVGQVISLAVEPDGEGPATPVLPDGELPFGPAYRDFEVEAWLAAAGGPLAAHEELVDGELLDGPAIVARVAREFSIGPRVLLAFLEARSGYVSGEGLAPEAASYPAGLVDPGRAGLWRQLNWLADRLNGGYYDLKGRDRALLTLADGRRLSAHPAIGPGSFAVQRALAFQSTEAELLARLEDFSAAYVALFGDPWLAPAAAPDPASIDFPALALPFEPGRTWWFTGGPHGGWGDGSAWASIDFVADEEPLGCAVSGEWVTAAAPGLVLPGGAGEVWLDLDGDGDRRTGPLLFHLHLAEEGRVAPGTRVAIGDRLGHPSCEGGYSSATHVHIGRLYDGEWLAAAGPSPLELGGWVAEGAGSPYDGWLRHRDGREREACECRRPGVNDVVQP